MELGNPERTGASPAHSRLELPSYLGLHTCQEQTSSELMGQGMGAGMAEDRAGDGDRSMRPWSKLSTPAHSLALRFCPVFLPKASEPRKTSDGAASHRDFISNTI